MGSPGCWQLIWDVQYRQAVAEKRDTGLRDIQRTTRKILLMEDVRGFGAPLNEIRPVDRAGSKRSSSPSPWRASLSSIIRDITAESRRATGIKHRGCWLGPSPVSRP